MTAWDELLDEFRKLGGTADNIRLGQGEFGRGLFPVDATKPIAIRIPDNLLVNQDDMVLIDGVPRVGPNVRIGERERSWLDRYQQEFAWPDGAEHISKMMNMAAALPPELRQSLSTKYGCGRWFEEPTDALVLDLFLTARSINYGDRLVVMPIVEMANHGAGSSYDLDNGVGLRGSFAGEILATYSASDSYEFFCSWGFAIKCPVAFSLGLTGKIDSLPLTIEREFDGDMSSERSWIPQLRKTPEGIRLPFLLIGNRNFPRLPKGIFYPLMRSGGYRGFIESFDLIHHVNQLHFVNLLLELDGIEVPIAKTVRTMALYQLRAMSFCWGVREI